MNAGRANRRNRDITAATVRLVNAPDGVPEHCTLEQALAAAERVGVDLIEVNGSTDPPTCKLDLRREPRKPVFTPLDPADAPAPLALALQEFRREADPFRKVHRLIDAIEVLVKLHTVILVNQWAQSSDLGDRVKGLLAAGLRTPSLGIWWQFARESARDLQERGEDPLVSGLFDFVLDGPLAAAMDRDDNLIAFRNGYAHGATPPDDRCRRDVERYGAKLDDLLRQAGHLGQIRLAVGGDVAGGRTDAGKEPVDPQTTADLTPGRCHLVADGHPPLDAHPLLFCNPDDGLFYFYNDLRTRAASMLNYEECRHLRSGDLREDLLGRFPLHQWSHQVKEVQGFQDLVESLAEHFKGRREELAELMRFLGRERGAMMVWGGPGVGKSALLARAVQVLGWPADLVRRTYPGFGDVDVSLEVVPYFVRRSERTNDADMMLDSLNQRLERKYGTGVAHGETIGEKSMALVNRLKAISGKLGDDQRLVLVIDGLDEGVEAEKLLASLPLSLPNGVLVIYASREHPQVRSQVYDAIDRETRWSLRLGGLGDGDIRALLGDAVNKYAIEAAYVEAVAARSKGNPLYLKLLCNGLHEGDYRLNEPESLPAAMEELYDVLLRRLGAQDPATWPVLDQLAVARDYLTPATLASMLGLDPAELSGRILPICMEVLHENPHTEQIENYQLFHESLREYLAQKHDSAIAECETRLADWCLTWRDHRGASQAYALRYGVLHLVADHRNACQSRDDTRAERRVQQACELLDDEKFRTATFRACGNAAPLRAALLSVQRILVERDAGSGCELKRIARYARFYHDEAARMYRDQRDALVNLGQDSTASLEPLAELAAMGRTPTDRVLLLLRALWPPRPGRRLPARVVAAVEEWLEDAGDGALAALWDDVLAAVES